MRYRLVSLREIPQQVRMRHAQKLMDRADPVERAELFLAAMFPSERKYRVTADERKAA